MSKIQLAIWAVLSVCLCSVMCDPDSTSNAKEPEHFHSLVFLGEKAIEVDAGDLVKEFKDNEVKANELYKGKLLKVKGKVYRVTTKGVELRGNDEFTVYRVQCKITPDDNDKVKNYKKDQAVIVQGVCEGKKSLYIGLKDCKFSD